MFTLGSQLSLTKAVFQTGATILVPPYIQVAVEYILECRFGTKDKLHYHFFNTYKLSIINNVKKKRSTFNQESKLRRIYKICKDLKIYYQTVSSGRVLALLFVVTEN